ncbi:hypothetical protein D3C75_660730 [compost metagenome]
MDERYIWVIFVTEKRSQFPNFYPIGTFTEHNKAIEEVNKLPKNKNYHLLRLPINQMFPYYHKKSSELVGMDGIHHEHFHFLNEQEQA